MITLLLLTACTPDAEPTDPAVVLVELATFASTDLHWALHATVGEAALGEMKAGDALSGALSYPSDVGPDLVTADAEIALTWSVAARSDEAVGTRYWDWVVDVEIERLVLPSAEVSGTAAWVFTLEVFDYSYGHHEWSGDLSIDGAEPVAIDWSGLATWSTLNAVDGHVDGVDVSWENEDPDVP